MFAWCARFCHRYLFSAFVFLRLDSQRGQEALNLGRAHFFLREAGAFHTNLSTQIVFLKYVLCKNRAKMYHLPMSHVLSRIVWSTSGGGGATRLLVTLSTPS